MLKPHYGKCVRAVKTTRMTLVAQVFCYQMSARHQIPALASRVGFLYNSLMHYCQNELIKTKIRHQLEYMNFIGSRGKNNISLSHWAHSCNIPLINGT